MARIIGIIIFIVGAIMCLIGLGDSIYNGLDFTGIILVLVGVYFILDFKKDSQNWKFLHEDDEEDPLFDEFE